MKPVTLKQIATKFDVTEMTVSSAIRGKGRMRKELRDEICAYANKMGYRRNLGPSLLMKGTYQTVALVCSHELERSYINMHVLGAMIATLEEAGYTLNIIQLPPGLEDDHDALVTFFRDWTVDGAIINITHDLHPKMVNAFKRFRIPKVWLNNKRKANGVYFDEEKASRELTRILIGKNIGPVFYYGNPTSHHHSAEDRTTGYQKACKKLGRTPYVFLRQSKADLEGILTRLEPPNPRAFGVVCHSSAYARLLMFQAIHMGYSEENIHIATFDHLPGVIEEFQVTQAVLDSGSMGRQTARMLLDKLQSPEKDHPSEAIPPEIMATG